MDTALARMHSERSRPITLWQGTWNIASRRSKRVDRLAIDCRGPVGLTSTASILARMSGILIAAPSLSALGWKNRGVRALVLQCMARSESG